MSKIIAYGWRRTDEDLAPLGAKYNVVDWGPKRVNRAGMVHDLGPGDVVRVLYVRDLSGSGAQNALWRKRVEATGAALEEHRPQKPPARIGRPSKLAVDDKTDATIRAIWLDPARSQVDRHAEIQGILGHEISRQALYRRYGKPGAPAGGGNTAAANS